MRKPNGARKGEIKKRVACGRGDRGKWMQHNEQLQRCYLEKMGRKQECTIKMNEFCCSNKKKKKKEKIKNPPPGARSDHSPASSVEGRAHSRSYRGAYLCC